MKKHAISQTHTRTVHSSLPTRGPPGSPPFVILCFFMIFAPGFVLSRYICFLIFLGPVFWFLVSSVYALFRTQFGWTIFSDVWQDNQGLLIFNLLLGRIWIYKRRTKKLWIYKNVHRITLTSISMTCLYRTRIPWRFKLVVHCPHTQRITYNC
jgi:hypothetical protein